MTEQIDLSLFDQPEILAAMFPLVYSPEAFETETAPDFARFIPHYPIEVEKGVRLDCGFWVKSKESPTILCFHDNTETLTNYESIGPLFKQRGMNLFVTGYRGYGLSEGMPTISNMLSDAHTILKEFQKAIEREGFVNCLFIMGRSIGSLPAIELASQYQDDIRGLIIESGIANNFRGLPVYLGLAEAGSEESPFLNKVKIRQIKKPTLIIHGEDDEVIPVTEAEELYHNSGARDKRLLFLPEAGHNDILEIAGQTYIELIGEFIKEYSETA